MKYIYILFTILFTVYGQLVVKWQVDAVGPLPLSLTSQVRYILKLLLNTWVISAFTSAFLAAVCWIIALSYFPLSYAYLFMSLSFVFVPLLSSILFKEAVTPSQGVGIFLIVLGVIVASRK